MKKKHALPLLMMLQILTIVISFYSYHTYFDIAFDARDNYWPFARYYLSIYKDEILFLFLNFIALFLLMFIKNILDQSYGRVLMIIVSYIIKGILLLALISALSGMHTLLNMNDFRAYLSISFFIIPASLLLVIIIFIVMIRELIHKISFKERTKSLSKS